MIQLKIWPTILHIQKHNLDIWKRGDLWKPSPNICVTDGGNDGNIFATDGGNDDSFLDQRNSSSGRFYCSSFPFLASSLFLCSFLVKLSSLLSPSHLTPSLLSFSSFWGKTREKKLYKRIWCLFLPFSFTKQILSSVSGVSDCRTDLKQVGCLGLIKHYLYLSYWKWSSWAVTLLLHQCLLLEKVKNCIKVFVATYFCVSLFILQSKETKITFLFILSLMGIIKDKNGISGCIIVGNLNSSCICVNMLP